MPGLFVSPFTFAGRELDLSEADYAVLGVPYDSSESYRTGSRFAPNAIREASRGMEDYDMLDGCDLLKIKLTDFGDINVSFGNYRETHRRIVASIKEILEHDAVPVSIGGEHTITHGVMSAYSKKPFALVFDAHLDLRREYIGEEFSHTCVTRRITELVGVENVMVVGVRSAMKEELEEARGMGLAFVDAERAKEKDVLLEAILKKARDRDVYLSVDMDVLDPAEARGVCNPEPGGLSYRDFVSSLGFIKNVNIVGFDLVEVAPLYDSYTPVLAAKLILKVLSRIEHNKG
ncbi:MAG: agmatinase [Candidatus Hydrothermarchaeaceae archaeon]